METENKMTFEEGMKQSIEELVEKKTALEKRIFELETEKSKLEDINLKLCEQNNELIEENGTIKTQVSILQGKNKGLKELVKGYENTRDRMIAMGFPTFKSVKEYSAKLKELEQENVELKSRNEWYSEQICNKECSEVWGNLTKAKEIIENIIQVTWGEGWNYSFDWKVKAEQFLKDLEK